MSGGAGPRTSKVLPPTLDLFGFCTWDAYYTAVSAKGVAEVSVPHFAHISIQQELCRVPGTS
jgi:hypothetical protein